jgi:hypothetical protein
MVIYRMVKLSISKITLPDICSVIKDMKEINEDTSIMNVGFSCSTFFKNDERAHFNTS